MKLMVPAIKPVVDDGHRQEASEQTAHLLAEIDALLSESFSGCPLKEPRLAQSSPAPVLALGA